MFAGVESVSVDMGSKKLTLTGDIDPVQVVSKLRKWCHTEIVSAGPAKEEKKKEESKPAEQPKVHYEAYPLYYQMRPSQYTQYHCVQSVVEEDNVGCIIC